MKTTVHFISFKPSYKFFRNWFVSFFIFFQLFFPAFASSQCTNYTVNWDYLDFLHSSATWYNTNSPATGQPFVTATMRQSQNFSIGPSNVLTIASTTLTVGSFAVSGVTHWGEVTEHTGETGAYGTGADVKFQAADGTSRTLTLTFASEVTNVKFSIFDIDNEMSVTGNATNATPSAVNLTFTKPAAGASSLRLGTVSGSTLVGTNTVTGTNVIADLPLAGGTGTDVAVNSANATINVDVAGPVKTITLTIKDGNTNGTLYLSDVTACVTGTAFPTNYYAPYTTPYTNQPSYFLVNPDFNLNIYMVDPVNRTADVLFTDPGTGGNAVNSIAYDPINHYVYYVMNGSGSGPANRALKRYNVTTGTISTIVADLNTLGIPTFIQGAEAASAAFYNGYLYLGIEGADASFFSNTESIIWRIEFDPTTGAATRASQVFGTPGDNAGGQPSHDWGDIVTKNGTIISHASNLITPYQSLWTHFDMATTTVTNTYTGYVDTAGQLGQIYDGTVYRLDNRIALYNNNGTTGTANTISTTSCSPAWNNRPANDASDPFRPALDFGDAPSTYDPNASSPAANQQACNNSTLRIGSVWDREWLLGSSTDASGDGGDEDGITTVSVMVSDGIAYNHVQEVVVLNNTGANAYLGGWLDYNANGVFDASEGVVVTVPSSASPQTISLGWTGITIAPGTLNSFIRVRLSSTALTTSSATGWLSDGETEDYPVISQAMPLSIKLLDFNATLTRDKNVLLRWKAFADQDALGFEVEKSQDQNTWTKIGWVNLNSHSFTADYSLLDQQPSMGRTYYRLKMVEKSGSSRYSSTRLIVIDELLTHVKVFPNPSKNETTVTFNSKTNQSATILIKSLSGNVIMKRPFAMTAGVNSTQFSTSNLSNGLYIVEVVTNERSYINRLTVSH